jgi:PAS domain S-box-containing protein
MPASSPDPVIAFLAGGGDMGAFIRAFDWTSNPLGPPEQWPSPLRTAVSLMLGASQPVYIAYGPELISLYNDGYLPIVGDKHPIGLGAPYATLWSEIWDVFKPIVEATMAGEAQHFVNLPIALGGRPGLPVGYFTFSYTALRDDNGKAVGFYCAATETTEQVEQAKCMAENEALLEQALAKGRGIGTWDWDIQTDRVVADERFAVLYGVDPDWAKAGAPISEFFAGVHPDDLPRLQAGVAEGMRTGGPFSEEYRLLQADGSSRWVVAEGRCRLSPDGVPIRFLGLSFDVSEQKAAERRRDALLALSDAIRDIDDADDLAFAASAILGRTFDASRVSYGLVDPDSEILVIQQVWLATGVNPVPTTINLRDFGSFIDDLKRGGDVVIDDVDQDPRTASASEALSGRGVGAFIGAPVLEQGRLAAMTYVVSATPRAWTRAELDLIKASTERVRTATERLRAVEALRRLNADLERQVVERSSERGTTWQVSPLMLSVVDLATGRFLRVNPAWSVVLGYEPEEIVGQQYLEFLHPDDVERTMAGYSKVEAGEPILDFENRYRAKAGDYRWLSWVAVPEGGKLYSTVRDITVEKAAVHERDRIFAASSDLIGVATFDGRLKSINPAWSAALGRSDDELLASPFAAVIHPDDLALTADVVATLQGGNPVHQFHVRLVKADGEAIPYAWSAVPDADLDSGLFYTVGRNITGDLAQAEQLRVAQDALRQSQKMEAVGQLTGGIAHDFNNLLAGIAGSLELIQKRMNGQGIVGFERHLGIAKASTERAAALTQRLLAFSRRQTLDPKPVEVNRLVRGMEDLLRRSVDPSIEIAVVGAIGLWLTKIDGPQLENAVLNLVINARDAMPDGGKITIETANKWIDGHAAKDRDLAPGQYISLCVTDTGTGMTPEVIERAFDPFYTTKPLGQGTGLGLSMIHGFVRQSGGQVRVYSEVGQGTTMCLYLPRFAGELDDDLAEVADDRLEQGQGETVLVIDDEEPIRMLISDVLGEVGYRILEAADGPAGLKILQSEARIDLLITDVGLPGGYNGRQVADAARQSRPGLKVLFVTGYAENAAVGNGHLDPGMQVITKPFPMAALALRVREIIEF